MKKAFYKKWWFWLIVVLVVIGAIGASGGDEDKKNQPEQTTIEQKDTEPEVEKEETETTNEDEGKTEETTTEDESYTADDAVALVKLALSESFEDGQYDVSIDDNIITIKVWRDGIAYGAVAAHEGNEELLKSWNKMAESFRSMSENVYNSIHDDLGLKDLHVAVYVLNEKNKDNTLLTTLDDTIVYDSVND